MKLDGWWVVAAVVLFGAGFVLWNEGELELVGGSSAPPAVSKQVDRKPACRSLKGEVDSRLLACLKEVPYANASAPARELVATLGKSGKIFFAGGAFPLDGVEVLKLEDQPDIRKLLLGTNEAKAAKALTEAGVRGFVVHRDLTQALDWDKVVLSRLAHHDFIEWFQLRYVTDEQFVYTVRSNPARIPVETGQALLLGLRSRLEGRSAIPQSWKPASIRLIGSGRLQGNTLFMRHSVGTNIESVLDELADKMRRTWERDVQIDGFGSLEDRLDELRLEIHVVMERAPVEPRSRYAMFELFELGIDGIIFQQRDSVKDDRFTYMPGSEAATRSHRKADDFLRFAVDEDWNDMRPWEEDTRTRLDIIRDQHFAEKAVGGEGGDAVRMVRGFPEVKMEELTDENLQTMLIDGGYWWLNNMREDKSFEYKYWPTQNRRSTEYNEVRHILAARDLADAWRYKQDPEFLRGSRDAMDWLLRYEVHDNDSKHPQLPHPPADAMLFRYPFTLGEVANKAPNQKLGTVAVALLGWISWAESTGSHEQDENIRKMAVFTKSRLLSNGKFDPYYVHRSHSYYGEKNDIVPGEAALALGEVAEYFDEPDWVDFYPKFREFYQPWFRSRAKQTNPYGRWPHASYSNETRLDLVQFGPWAVMASKQYYLLTGDEEAAKFGLEIADWMIDYYQWTEERAPWPDYVGGYYKLPEELPAMQSFCYSEGTAAAYTIAALYNPELKDKYDTSTRETLRFLKLMQFDDVSGYFAADPDKIHGGIKYAMNENKIRIDYVGHGLSTVSQYLDARVIDPAVGSLDIRDPKAWAAAAAMSDDIDAEQGDEAVVAPD
jgi:hypothetical protein